MKKKLLVLLLTSSMILMNFAPAYGAGDFTDSDNVTAVENPGSSDVDAIPDMGNAVNDEMSFSPEEFDNNGAVSYTHLDVYKRQCIAIIIDNIPDCTDNLKTVQPL